MQFQPTLVETLLDDSPNPSGLPFAFAVYENIINVTFKRYTTVVAPHPFIEYVVQKQVGQKGANYSMNAKDNFEFTKVIRYKRKK